MSEYVVIYEQGETSWGAYIPDLPGCVAIGDTLDEVKRLIRTAMKMHLQAMREDGETIPEPRTYVEQIGIAA